VLALVITAAASSHSLYAQPSVNKCLVGGRVTYQSEPCPKQASHKSVDVSDKNKALGRDLAEQARRDKAALEAREAQARRRAARERAAEQGLAVGDAAASRPMPRNLALERIEQAAGRLLPTASAPAPAK
jgi:hypothetical protein